MEMRQVGSSGLLVPVLGLGTMTWGHGTDPQEAGAILREYLDAGGALVDTAPWRGSPAAQEILGALLESVVARDEVTIVATGAWRTGPGGVTRDASRGGLLTSLDDTLLRLGTDHVDLFVTAGPDGRTSWHETVSALEIAITSGRARYVGLSGVSPWQAVRAGTLLEARGLRLAAVGAEVSLLARTDELDHAASSTELGTGMLAWAPLGRGVLTGKYRRTVPADSRAADPVMAPYVEALLDDRCAPVVEAAVTAAQGLGLTPAQLALAWTWSRPTVASAVVGPRSVAQLRDALAADGVTLPTAVVDALDEVSVPA